MARIAVLLATFNGEGFLREQLDSLLEQTLPDFTCYVHDDGSTDATLDIVREYAARHPGRFVLMEYPATGSAKSNFVSMLVRTKEPYIMFCDQDDVWKREKIAKSILRMEQEEAVRGNIPLVVYSDLVVVDRSLKVIAPSYMGYMKRRPDSVSIQSILISAIVSGCTMLMNRAAVDKALEHIDVARIPMHDLWIAAVTFIYGNLLYIEEPLVLYRQHSSNVMGARKRSKWDIVRKLLHYRIKPGFFKAKRAEFTSPRSRAVLLSKYPDLPDLYRSIIVSFAGIGSKNYFQRIHFYITRGFVHRKNLLITFLWV